MQSLDSVKQLYSLVRQGKKVISGMEKVLKRKEASKEEMKKSNPIIKAAVIIAVIAAVCGIAYAVFKYLKPDYLKDSDEEDFEDDFFDDDEEGGGDEMQDGEESEKQPA